MSPSPILEMRNISKTFGPVRALRDVSLTVYRGELHALMGENGAGKSTLMKILSGAYIADPGGSITIEGKPQAEARGAVAVIYQELSLAPNLTVAENMFLGREIATRGVVDRAGTRELAQPILDRLGVSFDARTLVGTLSLGERQMVEIARALTTDARLIVMDEPTTSLSARETERLFEVIARLKSEGIAIIYISHRMEEVYALADRCSVLRDGVYIGTLDRDELSAARLVQMMVGRDLDSFYKKEHIASPDHSGTPLMRVRDMADGGLVKPCSFDLYRGEVLGIAGLVGSGRTELARLIYGADPRVSGTVELDGKPVATTDPRTSLASGIAYLTEDRKEAGLLLEKPLRENLTLAVLERFGGWRIDTAAEDAALDRATADFDIRAPSRSMAAGKLSGGNQQKLLLAKTMLTEPRIVIIDEPTRGIDVGTKRQIYAFIRRLAEEGRSVIVISSEMPEVIGLSDRVLVMREGRVAGIVEGDALTEETIVRLAMGVKEAA